MDKTENYIKMCEKAMPILMKKLAYFNPDYKNCLFYHLDDVYWFNEENYSIWLPRQDQLQEILNSPAIEWLIDKFYYWVRREHNVSPVLNTMEKLWLAFVMSELYQKIWDGSKWIENKGVIMEQWICQKCNQKGGFKCMGNGFIMCSSCGTWHVVAGSGRVQRVGKATPELASLYRDSLKEVK